MNKFKFFKGVISDSFSSVTLPFVRRIFGGGMIANDLVAVQPMREPPIGMLYYMDFQYSGNTHKSSFKFFRGNVI